MQKITVKTSKTDINNLQYFVPENITAQAVFTTRLGGVSGLAAECCSVCDPVYSLNLGFKDKENYDKNENVLKNYEIIAETLGFSVNNIIYAHQKHTDNILVCDENFLNISPSSMLPLPRDYIYDAMVTNIPGILLSVRSADCVPVLFFDEENNAVGAAHCGWRGTIQKLQIKTALRMRELYGTDLHNLKAAIGPGISQCCYEVSKDFYENFADILGDEVIIYFDKKSDGKYHCDLKGINKMLLLKELREENIDISQNCTCCEENIFFSHRRQGEFRGTHAAFIGVKKLGK
ncbi:MAG: peptidoglycan editing factor PgeF [Oscillospiraceae bacterium]|nr:peptidoglycan editing factor PgeF [Oscillospiraceae bacterium]